jgi:ATP-dependent DNA helicase RecQ
MLAESVDDLPEDMPAGEGDSSNGLVDDSTAAVAAGYDEELFAKLRAWRLDQARAKSVAPFMVAHDAALQELARVKPVTVQKLMGVKGFGSKKIDQYGEGILQVVAGHAGQPLTGEGTDGPGGMGWSGTEDTALLEQFRAGTGLAQVAEKLGRTPEMVWSRLQQLL